MEKDDCESKYSKDVVERIKHFREMDKKKIEEKDILVVEKPIKDKKLEEMLSKINSCGDLGSMKTIICELYEQIRQMQKKIGQLDDEYDWVRPFTI